MVFKRKSGGDYNCNVVQGDLGQEIENIVELLKIGIAFYDLLEFVELYEEDWGETIENRN